MRKPMILDQYGTPLVRTDALLDVLNGSQLVVAQGTVAYILDGGSRSGPYSPGEYSLNTDIGFFRKGNRGRSMTIIRIGTAERYRCDVGSGKIWFKNAECPIERVARAPLTMLIRVCDPNAFLEKALHFSPKANHETLDRLLVFYAADAVRHRLQKALNENGPSRVDLQEVECLCSRDLRPGLHEYGLELIGLKIKEINVEENAYFKQLECEAAKLKVLFDNDRQLYSWHSVMTQGGNRSAADAAALAASMPEKESAPDTWGGL